MRSIRCVSANYRWRSGLWERPLTPLELLCQEEVTLSLWVRCQTAAPTSLRIVGRLNNLELVMKKMTNAVQAANAIYQCGGEIYHLEILRLEKGDGPAVTQLATHYQQSEGLSVPDAHIRAGRFINDIDALKRGDFGFKSVRARIAASARAQFGRPGDDPTFAGA
jgi:hypothetical protein